jgi:4-hydroxy-tetrahydrodipicolinate synthase
LNKIAGSLCALATPFRGDDLDLDAFGALIDYQLAGGTQGLVVAGSTGEAHALDAKEFDRLLGFAVERVAGRVPVIAGTGTANTRKTIVMNQRAKALGADAVLVVTPYYVRPTQEGLHRHFLEVADHGGLPIILYNVPTRTGCDLQPATVA